MVASVNAEFDWINYGNGNTPLWNEQYVGSFGVFNSSVINSSINTGYGYAGHTQPLVHQGVIFVSNGNYMEAYNSNLTLLDSLNTGGLLINQFGFVDFNNDGINNEVAGIWNVTGTGKHTFRVYPFNFTSNKFLNKTYEYNLTSNFEETENGVGEDNFPDMFGLRCGGRNCYSVNQVLSGGSLYENFTVYNNSGVFEKRLYFSNGTFMKFGDDSLKGHFKTPIAWEDVNIDGKNEYLVYTSNWVALFNENGNATYYFHVNNFILDSKMFYSNNLWKIATLYVVNSGSINLVVTDAITNSVYWSKTFSISPTAYGVGSIASSMAISDDFDGDPTDNEIFLIYEWFDGGNDHRVYDVLKGSNGNILNTQSSGFIGVTLMGYPPSASFTLADMDNDGYKDFVFFSTYPQISSNMTIYSPHKNSFIYTVPSGESSCVPADVNIDGFLEIVCSDSTSNKTSVFFNNGLVNNNPVINSVSYQPSLVVNIGQGVSVVINATDSENNTIYYTHKCFDSDNFSADSLNYIQGICSYDYIGFYNLTVGVSDHYHSNYNYFSQEINVTSAVIVCNNNGICESGEDSINCPNDCLLNNNGNPQSSSNGGATIPTELVDTTNINQGLLPEIYYGTMGFLSNTINPVIILVFFIFFIFIILAIALIIKKIGQNVVSISR